MCVSKEVSLGAFIICSLTCYYLYKRNRVNDRWIALMFGYFGSMQFLEYLMWKDQECNGLNQTATDIGFIHNILQPVLSLGAAYYFTGGKIPFYVYGVFIIYIITSLPRIIEAKKDNQCSLPCNGTDDGLSWKHTETKHAWYVWGIFCIALALPFITMKKNGHIYSGIIVTTYIISHFISVSRCPNSITPPNGSWWCLMAVFVPLLALKIN